MSIAGQRSRHGAGMWLAGTLLCAGASLGLMGCDDTVPYDPGGGLSRVSSALTAFRSCDEVDEYIVDHYTEMFLREWLSWGWWGPVFGDVDAGMPPENGAPDDGTGGRDESPDDFSETNTQEAGVDEADLVKTDGQYLYVLLDGQLRIADSWPAEDLAEVASVAISGYGENLFLVGDTVITVTSLYGGGGYWRDYAEDVAEPSPGDDGMCPEDGCGGWVPGDGFTGTRLTFVDVSDRENPEITREVDVEGYFVATRRVDGQIYLVNSTSMPYDWQAMQRVAQRVNVPENIWQMNRAEREAWTDRNRARVRSAVAAELDVTAAREALLPDVREGGEIVGALLACQDLYRPSFDEESTGVLSVIAIPTTGSGDPQGVGLVSNGWHVYASRDALYIARDSMNWWWFSSEQPSVETTVHAFGLGDGSPSYRASGAVPGFIKDRYSLSEHEGYLRIVTTDAPTWWWGGVDGPAVGIGGDDVAVSPPEAIGGSAGDGTDGDGGQWAPKQTEPAVQANSLFVLQQRGDRLVTVGEVRGFGETERVYAVRFMGDVAYVVTFRETDPLFSIDLSVPTNPRIRGELHIPGFSNYLHPISETHLVGVGRDADETGRITGFQVSLFDVSDIENPLRVDLQTIPLDNGWAWSESDYDPRAFTWYASRNLFAVPVTVESWDGTGMRPAGFSGLIVYHVTPEDGISEAGRIEHELSYDDGAWWWYQPMRRAVFIGDYVYGISHAGVSVAPLEDIGSPLSFVPWLGRLF